MTKKVRRRGVRQYRLAALQEAVTFCPPIYPCKDCGWPVVNGYCCTTCGSSDPH